MVLALKQKMKEQKGFTLIELLAVIVILGIIAAIAIPAIGNVITKSDNKAKVQDALLVIDAAKLYVADNSPTADVYLTQEGKGAKDGKAADTAASLSSYLERVKDSGYLVTVTYSAPTPTQAAKYTYSISNHDGAMVAKSVTDSAKKADTIAKESELVTYIK